MRLQSERIHKPNLKIPAIRSWVLLLLISSSLAGFGADVEVYFSPNGGATDAIVREITNAKREILVQAYSFTSAPIAEALVTARKRGLKVEAILDKSNLKEGYSSITFLENSSIPVYIDDRVKIAHSKIMIIDNSEVITGSFNFTKAAETHNTENLLIFKNDPGLVAKYLMNYNWRLSLSLRAQEAVSPGMKAVFQHSN
jgi:phosphatidylserine/phosphatidylglycerophosphate/cardiolipin synthase-like enzyme